MLIWLCCVVSEVVTLLGLLPLRCMLPTSRNSGGNNMNNNGGIQVGIADDQAKDFDFEKTEMKYDSTGMFHWGPARNLEECILVSSGTILISEA
ncbi:unnamed protein product [Timema podura]|uniref:Uncharacterized protein n=1 Tax=Timema podura TaxID=61482 RepID=A0ABN7NDC0_TIMPD|nr:unnamed protein product [Timema podura]